MVQKKHFYGEELSEPVDELYLYIFVRFKIDFHTIHQIYGIVSEGEYKDRFISIDRKVRKG